MVPSTSISRAIILALTSPPGAIVSRCSTISMVPSTSPSMTRSSRLSICPLNTTLLPSTAFAVGCAANDGEADITNSLVFLADSLRRSDRRHSRASLERNCLSHSGSDLMLQAVQLYQMAFVSVNRAGILPDVADVIDAAG